jgi:cellulose synthase/poly-beta-1,6-N-acetylglucosamine synthase-like glycosyltransferase
MVILITPTGGRPKQFELCMRWMQQQTYANKIIWIVIDDCEPRTTDILTDDFRDKWTIIRRYPFPRWKEGSNTQSRNLQIGLDIVKVFSEDWIEAVLFIEDDDYYKPDYIQKMVAKLKDFDVVGEINTVYYHVERKGYKVFRNIHHSSLFQTGIRVNMIPVFESCLKERHIDISFFKKVQNANLFQGENLAIGIKGLPGRYGIGVGHKGLDFISDRGMNKLKELIGDDYKFYQ